MKTDADWPLTTRRYEVAMKDLGESPERNTRVAQIRRLIATNSSAAAAGFIPAGGLWR